MEDRLLKLLDAEQLSSSKFADVIGVQRSSVSHILSGRNKPSFDFLQKTLKAFPLLNADWLILAEGDMYEDMSNFVNGGLFNPVEQGDASSAASDENLAEKHEETTVTTSNKGDISSISSGNADSVQAGGSLSGIKLPAEGKKVTKVILFYDDNSFHTYEPGS